MKKTMIVSLMAALAVVIAGYGVVQAHGSYGSNWGHMGSNMYGNWGHMGGYGSMMDYDSYRDSSCWSTNPETFSGRITGEKAGDIVAWHLSRTNDRLKVGGVVETEDGFEVSVLTKKGEALVDKLLVEKDTGRVYRVFE